MNLGKSNKFLIVLKIIYVKISQNKLRLLFRTSWNIIPKDSHVIISIWSTLFMVQANTVPYFMHGCAFVLTTICQGNFIYTTIPVSNWWATTRKRRLHIKFQMIIGFKVWRTMKENFVHVILKKYVSTKQW